MIYVDTLMPCIRNRNWRYDQSCHLMCDPGGLHELHKFADKIGLKRSWFQDKAGSTPHYDLSPGVRRYAVTCGAIEIDRDKCVEIIRAWRASRQTQLPLPL
jgi:hypothetical protein